ncbi:MAG: DUF4399 domain-containing protein [Hydrogenophaga sp.]
MQRTRVPIDVASQQVGFANLWNGQRVLSPFKVAFAVRGMGVVPAKHPLQGTGHHHILVNQRLPLNVRQDLPFNDNHLHFGGGQTSTVLNLPPGKHRLRLLFADAGHVPYFVFSPEIEVDVVARRSELLTTQAPRVSASDFERSCARWYEDQITRPDPMGKVVYFQNLRDGDVVQPRLNVQLGVEGYGVCSADVKVAKTGHFDLEILRNREQVRRLRLVNGQTQADLSLAEGVYELKLQLRNYAGLALGEPDRIKIEVKK